MTTKGWPESVKARSRVEQVDKVHPDSSVMEGDPFGRARMQPLHDFHECMLQASAYFSSWRAFLS